MAIRKVNFQGMIFEGCQSSNCLKVTEVGRWGGVNFFCRGGMGFSWNDSSCDVEEFISYQNCRK